MTAARRPASILAADVGLREHRDGTPENRAQRQLPSEAITRVITQGGLEHAAGRARARRACEGRQRASFRPPDAMRIERDLEKKRMF
jgi:hypothetical protein